jgi:uncharacterized damage-inducible protein DinB
MAGLNELEELYDYCYWTNGRFFEVVGRLTPEEFAQPVAGSYGSVRDTLVHMLSAEWGWLERCGGPKRGPALFAADYQSFSAVEDRWRDVEAWVRAFLANLSKEDLGRRITFAIANVPQRTMPLADLMRHGALYGIHHRGQVAFLLRALGRIPGNFDFVLYCDNGGPRPRTDYPGIAVENSLSGAQLGVISRTSC